MKELYQLLDRIIPSKISVLLHGESGTGKELLAKAIHYNGSLANKPLICINCAALNAQILEGQLFGYVKGAFTGATQDQKGLIEQAHGGTLFLDEIGDLSLEIQTKFLRVLQEGEVLPLGSHQVRKVKIRVISATHRDLTQDVKVGRFREDLYYRLAKIHVPVPALRERREDIPLLIDYFLKDFAKKTGSPIKKISQKALTCLQNAPWPGNVRQLENTLKMILTLNPSARINSAHLPPELLPASKREKPPRLAKARNKFMKEYFAYLFNQAGGQIRVAAELADVKRESLYRIMRKVSFR
jgi:transcriptional regulator with PAS, ATPase and Fis domain